MPLPILLAKFRGRTPSYPRSGGRILDVVYLDITIPPPAPIQIGDKVQIYSLERKKRTRTAQPNGPKYTAHATDIRGTVMGIRAVDEEVVEMILRNEDYLSTTEYAHLSFPNNNAAMTDTPWWVRILGWALKQLGAAPTRRIPVEGRELVEGEVEGY
ncbi:hypothetical protein ONZ51_g2683 [Trametes cubensis]|uniref:Uncharacterized protein n=1 Tax=Trametes cubensis TaxID=1111947 RepID=A0AAD7U1K4_9APHY|nr:hypothetical protein ONZ51_g2683 [Trametes cubensis]